MTDHVRAAIRERLRQMTQHLTPPVSIDALWPGGPPRVVVDPTLPSTVLGLSVLAPSVGTRPDLVWLNGRVGPFVEQFTLAHECIHAWYHRHLLPGTIRCYLADPLRDLLEREANAGAAELVLPYAWFQDTALAMLGQTGLAGDAELDAFLATAAAQRWAHQARVSLSVLRYHLLDLGWVRTAIHVVAH